LEQSEKALLVVASVVAVENESVKILLHMSKPYTHKKLGTGFPCKLSNACGGFCFLLNNFKNKMLTIGQCRSSLGDCNLTDDQIKNLRDNLYTLVEIILDDYVEKCLHSPSLK
jgi:hypothetical protein